MKILYIWHAAVEKSYRKLFVKLAEKNEVIVCTSHRWFESSTDQRFKLDLEIDRNFKIYPFYSVFRNHIRSFFYPNFFKMVYVLIHYKPDVIYLKEEPYSINAFQWVLLSRLFIPNAKIIIESDENMNVNHPVIFKIIENYVLRKIRAIACVPTRGTDLYNLKGFKGKIFKTFYFYNEEIFFPVSKDKAQEELNIFLKNGIYFGYAGRLTEEKGIEDLLNAFLMLYEKHKDIYLVLVGKGEEKFEKKIKDFIIQKNLSENIIILKPLPQEKIVYLYNLIDALVLPSHSTEWWIEQFGRVIVEAMACGTPVIGSSSGEIPIVINNNELVFTEKDVKTLYNIMEKFAKKEFTKQKFSSFCIDNAGQFSLSNVARNKLEIIESVYNS